MAPSTPQEWFDLLNKRFTATTRTVWSDKSSRPTEARPRNQHLDHLWSYYIGDPPLPQVADEYEDVFRDILRKARCNYAPMCVKAMLDRMALLAVSTSKDRTSNGDDLAAEIMEESGFAAQFKDLQAFKFAMRESFAMVVPSAVRGGNPTVHAIDPRRCVAIPDKTNPIRLVAALVKEWDEVEEAELAHVFLPGKKYTWRRPNDGGDWSLENADNPETVRVPAELGGIPVVRFENADGLGEYEAHIDVLDRIIDTTLQRIVLTKFQAFRQRGVSGDEDEDVEFEDQAGADDPMSTSMITNGEDGRKIDWREVFQAGPGKVWKVPANWQFWESSQADMSPMLQAKRDDAKEFAAVTFTPLYLITPDDANGSAAGAGLLREGLTSKVRDRRDRDIPALKLLWRIIFAMKGEPERAKELRLHWGPMEFRSLAEKGSATAQAVGVLSRKRILSEIWEMSPQDIEDNENELAAQRLLESVMSPPRPPATGTESAAPGQPAAPPPDAPQVNNDLPAAV